MSGFALFYRLILRPLFRQPGRALVILLAVALGVAAVVAIDLAGSAAAGSFHSSIESLTGKSTFEVTAAGGVPDSVVGRLARLPFDLQISPRIEDHAVVVGTGQSIPLIGIDMIGAANDPNLQKIDSAQVKEEIRHINDPNTIWVTPGLAQSVGAHLSLLIDDQTRTYEVRGILPGSSDVNGDAVLMDMAAAQMATGKQGRVDRILIRTPAEGDFATWESRLRGALPAGVLLNAQGAETAANRRMLAAFRWNLRILSYIALVVGAFLIYSALSVSVVRRRPDIGTIRALGASRKAVLLAFLGEAAAFGTLGSLLALPLGRALAAGAVQMLSTTVNSLYVSSRPGSMNITAGSVLLAMIVGIGVSCLSALAPAREASMVPPTEAMARGRREYDVGVQRRRDAIFALVLAVCGVVAAQAPAIGGRPMLGYLAALLFVAAAALLTPLVVQATATAGSDLLRRVAGMEGLLAARSLVGSLRRTSVLVAALATAVAMITSVGIMVGSFRQTVLTWMQTELPADLYLRPASWSGGDQHPTMSPEIAARIAQVPGVRSVRRLRAYDIQYQGLPATLAGAQRSPAGEQQGLQFLYGLRTADVLRQLASGNFAAVSEPFANKHHVKTGMSITLPLGSQKVTFRVIGVFYDYGDQAGLILVDWSTLLRYLPDPAPSNLAVFLAPGANLASTRTAIEKAIGNHDVLVFSNREIRQQGIRVFDQTFEITYALEAISVLVAVGGIAGALVSIVIDRRREFAVLRFLGATARQIRGLILVEAGLIGILASGIGLTLGVVLSLVLVYVINKQSFGWTIRFHWPVAVLLVSLAIVYIATVLAGLYPARLAIRTTPIEVIHEE